MEERIDVWPTENGKGAVVETKNVLITCESAELDGSDNIVCFYMGRGVALIKVDGVPLEVPRLIRRAIEYGESGTWE